MVVASMLEHGEPIPDQPEDRLRLPEERLVAVTV